jgi:hypothetical protein
MFLKKCILKYIRLEKKIKKKIPCKIPRKVFKNLSVIKKKRKTWINFSAMLMPHSQIFNMIFINLKKGFLSQLIFLDQNDCMG